MLGDRPLLWCWPSVPPGDGLKYALAASQGEWIELQNHKEEEVDPNPWRHDIGFIEP